MNKRYLIVAAAMSLALTAACGPKTEAPAADPAPAAAEPGQPAASKAMALPATTASQEALAAYTEGWALFENENMAAHASFKAATAADPSFAMGHMMAALSATSSIQFAENLQLAVANKAGASEGEQALISGWESAFSGDVDGWIDGLQRLAELHPDAPRAWMLLGNAYTNNKRTGDARAAYAKSLELDPGFVAGHVALGDSLLSQDPKDFAEAEKHFLHAAELAPDEPNVHDRLGDVHRAQNKLELAYDDYTRAANLAPELSAALQQRAHVSSFLGNYDEARADYARAVELADASGVRIGANIMVFSAYVPLHQGDLEAGLAELRAIAAAADTDYPERAMDIKGFALTSAARVAIELGDADTANAVIADLGVAFRQRADALANDAIKAEAEAAVAYWEGLLAARLGDAEGAAAKAAEYDTYLADSNDPLDAESMHEILGMAAWYQEDYEAAIEHLSQGDLTNEMFAKYFLARAHEAAGNAEEASRLFGELAVHNFNGVSYALYRKDILARAAG
jgi:tetratricopeptide (TPR) repeat protein